MSVQPSFSTTLLITAILIPSLSLAEPDVTDSPDKTAGGQEIGFIATAMNPLQGPAHEAWIRRTYGNQGNGGGQ